MASNLRQARALAGSCALVALLTVSANGPALGARGTIDELLDPASVAATACGMQAMSLRPSLVAAGVRIAALGDPPAAPPPIYEGTGNVTFKVTTASPQAQAYFNQGLRLIYGFNHFEAIRAFREAQRLDPNCAMCFWGEAVALGMNINAPMDPAAGAPAVAAAAKATALAGPATPKEQAMIAAVAKRYAPFAAGGQAADETAYAQAMREVRQQWPDDSEVGVLFAEALMNLQPWDYWEPGGRQPKGGAAEAIASIEAVLARDPEHPQAAHLFIHLVEASTNPARAEAAADQLGKHAPALGHLVHMPSHIYHRIGRYKDSLNTNLDAIAADQAYLAQAQASDAYAKGYFPHNIHFALTSAQMGGDAANVAKMAALLPTAVSTEVVLQLAWVQPIVASPYVTQAIFADTETVFAMPPADPRLPYVEALRRYARAVSAARIHDLDRAQAEAAALAEITAREPWGDLQAAGLPAADVLAIARLIVEARIAQARGDHPGAVALLQQAVAAQDSLAYMEPPFWEQPVRQSLGAALIRADRAAEAIPVLEASLISSPNNGWALWALAEARRRTGDTAGADAAERLLAKAWFGPKELLTLDRI